MAIKGISTKEILFGIGGIIIGAIGISLLKGFEFNLGYGLGGQSDRVSYHSELSDVRSNLAEYGYGRKSVSGTYSGIPFNFE
jgi:hypothetical protein